MTSTKKILLLLLLLGIVLLITIIYHSNNSGYTDNTEKNAVEPQIIRRRRAIRPANIHRCKFNQYYDQEEGRCLGVPGGGKVLHIENGQSCGINILKPHCKSSLYYHICKRDKSILAQCANKQIFDNRLQRCVDYDSSTLTPSIIPPDDYTLYDHVRMPRCTRYGRFPVPGHCSMFYTCDTNGHRLHQSVFKCPQNTGYQVDRGVCNIVADCVNDNSVGTTVCVPDAPGENVESPNLDEAVDGNEKEISEILEESKAGTDDPIVKKEENVNFKTFDDTITTTPINIIGSLSENNDNDNGSDTEVSSNKASSLNPVKEDLIPEGIDGKIIHSQAPNQLETMQKVSDEGQNEEDGSSLLNLQITSPLTTELDDTSHSITEQYRNNEDSTVTPTNFSDDSVDLHSVPTISNAQESTPINDVSPNIDEKMQDAATEQYKNNEGSIVPPSNLNTDSSDLYSTPLSNVPESSPISDVLPNKDEKIQDAIMEQNRNNEDSTMIPSNFNTDSVDSAPTISNVPESSPISDVSPNVDEKVQDAPTEQYKNNEDSTLTPSNFNTDSVDQYSAPTISNEPESSPISDVSPNVNKKMQDAITEEYRNNEDSTSTPSNFNTDSVDQYSAPTISNVQESTPISDVSPNINEKMQDVATEQYKNNEDSTSTPSNFNTDSVDQYSAPTISNVQESTPISDVSPNINEKMQDATTEQYKNNEDSTSTPSNFNTDSVDQYSGSTISNEPESSPISNVSPNGNEKMQDAITEEYRNNEDSTLTPSNFNTDSVDQYSAPTISNVQKSTPISDVSPNINEKMQDVATEQYKNNEDSTLMPSNFNSDSVDQYSAPTISNVQESTPISDVSPNINEKMQDAATEQYKNNEDSTSTPSNFNTDSVDQYSGPTISNEPESSPISDVSPNGNEKMQDAITKEYRNNEDSIVTPSNFNTDSVDKYPTPKMTDVSESSPISDVPPNIDEKMQDAITEEYRNNENSAVTPSNLNTDSVDEYPAPTINNAAESSPISSMSSKIDEEMQDATTEQYRNNKDSTSNFNSDSITDSPRYDDSDVLSSPSTLAILPSQTAVDQFTTEGLSQAISSIDSKLAGAPDGVESVSARYLPDNTDESYLRPTTESTLISKEAIAPMGTATTIQPMQEPPISDTDLVTQSSKDSMEASPAFVTK